MTGAHSADRMQAERLRRLEQAWRDDAPAGDEADRVRKRLSRRRTTRRVVLPRAVIVAAASALCLVAMGVLAAQVGKVVQRIETPAPAPPPAGSSAPRGPGRTTGSPLTTKQDAVCSADAAVEIDLELGEIQPVSSSFSPPSRTVPLPVALPDAASPVEEGEWSRVADALRQGDNARAEQELDHLSKSAEPSQRDAALLARAELWLTRGEKARARSVLHRLAASGATPFIRRRASQLLATADR